MVYSLTLPAKGISIHGSAPGTYYAALKIAAAYIIVTFGYFKLKRHPLNPHIGLNSWSLSMIYLTSVSEI